MGPPEVARLTELRLHAREARLTALLALGLDERAASEAEALTVEHPWREQPWRALLLALHRAGRQGDALRARAQYRTRLREDLGLDPSPEFVALERDVATDAEPSAPSHRPAAGVPSRLRPRPSTRRSSSSAATTTWRRVVDLVRATPAGHPARAGRDRQDAAGLVGPRREIADALGLALRWWSWRRCATSRASSPPSPPSSTCRPSRAAPCRSRCSTSWSTGPLLLVLDNCEHVLDTIAGVRRAAARRRVRRSRSWPPAASRWACRTETVYKVPALPVADAGADPEAVVASPAVALFLQRAAAANPDFVADEADRRRRGRAVPAPRRRAAGHRAGRGADPRRCRPTEITERLGDRFGLLAGSSRVADERHRSLQDLVDWSYQLLDPAAQQLFRRLSTFAGAFDLDAAEQVCGYGDVPRVGRGHRAGLAGRQVDGAGVRRHAHHLPAARDPARVRRRRSAAAEARRARPPARRLDRRDLRARCRRPARRRTSGAGSTRSTALRRPPPGRAQRPRRPARSTPRCGIVVAAREYAFRRLRYELIGWAESALAADRAPTTSRWPRRRSASSPTAGSSAARSTRPSSSASDRSTLAARSGTDTLGMAERALGNAWFFQGDMAGTHRRPSTGWSTARWPRATTPASPTPTTCASLRRDADRRHRPPARAYAERAMRAAAAQPQPHGAGAGGLRHRHLVRRHAPAPRPRASSSAARRSPAKSATAGSSCSPAPRRCGCARSTASRCRPWPASPTSSRRGTAPATGPTSGSRSATCSASAPARRRRAGHDHPRRPRARRRRRRLPVRARRRRRARPHGRRAAARLGDRVTVARAAGSRPARTSAVIDLIVDRIRTLAGPG